MNIMRKTATESYVAILNIKDCLGCGKCIEKCLTKAIPYSLIGLFSLLLEIDKAICTGCGDCIPFCPHKATKLVRIFP